MLSGSAGSACPAHFTQTAQQAKQAQNAQSIHTLLSRLSMPGIFQKPGLSRVSTLSDPELTSASASV